jgi:hypothetical protein
MDNKINSYLRMPSTGDVYFVLELRYQKPSVYKHTWGAEPEEDKRIWQMYNNLPGSLTHLYKTEDDAWDAFNHYLSETSEVKNIQLFHDEWEYHRYPQWKNSPVPKEGDIVFYNNSIGKFYLTRVERTYGDGMVRVSGNEAGLVSVEYLFPVSINYFDGNHIRTIDRSIEVQ